jgi:hypothetical protein
MVFTRATKTHLKAPKHARGRPSGPQNHQITKTTHLEKSYSFHIGMQKYSLMPQKKPEVSW